MEFTRDYAQYYRDHEDLYHHNEYATGKVAVEGKNIAANLMSQASPSRLVLHLINHNYDGRIEPRGRFKVSVDTNKKPSKVYMVSPDFQGTQDIPFEFEGKSIKIKVSSLKFYDAVVIQG